MQKQSGKEVFLFLQRQKEGGRPDGGIEENRQRCPCEGVLANKKDGLSKNKPSFLVRPTGVEPAAFGVGVLPFLFLRTCEIWETA